MNGTISERAREVVDEFSMLEDWEDRYGHLIEHARSLPVIDDRYRTDEYRVAGCQSQVWVHAEREGDLLRLTGDSDALITKGLVALLLRVLDGQPAPAVRDADLSFLDEIGLREHLSPTRANGLAAMVQRIKAYAGG
jgi:cysteine desulfuration protein SufE